MTHTKLAGQAPIIGRAVQSLVQSAGHVYVQGVRAGPVGGGAGSVGTISNTNVWEGVHWPDGRPTLNDTVFRRLLLQWRLRAGDSDFSNAYPGFNTTLGTEEVFVHFVSPDDELVVMSDPKDLYPSDELVTKMRLCAK